MRPEPFEQDEVSGVDGAAVGERILEWVYKRKGVREIGQVLYVTAAPSWGGEKMMAGSLGVSP